MQILIRIYLVLLITAVFHINLYTQNMNKLKEEINNIISATGGTAAVVFINPANSDQQLMINAGETFHAASTMKVAVMTAVFTMIEERKLKLTDSIRVVNSFRSIVDSSSFSLDIREDSGDKLYSELGKNVTVERLLNEMITVSGNLATNLLIELVSADYIEALMNSHGIRGVNVLRGVEDIRAFEAGLNNTVTAGGLADLFLKLDSGEFCSAELSKKMIDILLAQKFNSMIPKYLPEGVKVAHKTGSITAIMHDAGIVYLPDGRKYILVILNKGFVDAAAIKERSAQISKSVYHHFTGE